MKTIFRLLTELSSRKTISKITGQFAKSKMSKQLIPRFAKTYGINIKEAEKQLDEYVSLNDFFTRRLKKGARKIHQDENMVISPVDGKITGIGTIENGQIVNVKGQDYTIEDLLNQSPRTVTYKHGFYMVLYLSPSDYHRIHAPISGKVVETELIPGKVYPVNDFGLTHMPKVLSRNERLISYIRHENTEVALVKVGAMNVSSIRLVDPSADEIHAGAEMAYFEFGSTVVLLFEKDSFQYNERKFIGEKVKMGEALGQILTK
ncbi:archaetidylserine decarboxylase [Chengkuizengella axinellae]|uniref:Phosphatidylserine decarboxylase proenzyme n=1 Tax=Chengkuizengella axinellae TaxID=3064388 RepID=A0ABT9ITF6_9BACL|nr:archaetidylserine decarboxylase [Chengkuizengella sp. 2205SS18-9]MDP5272635.1 archaetidylserine decarboxylase [Chengkuizengella sp. 2205SS18-9]